MARTYLTLSLSLPPSVVEALGDRARATGKTTCRVAAEIVVAEVAASADPTDAAESLRAARAEVDKLWRENAELRRRPPRTFDQIGADRLADEVAVLVHRGVLDSRSPAGDALLDYRDPPSTPRADRMARLEAEVERLEVKIAELEGAVGRKDSSRDGQVNLDASYSETTDP